MKRIIFVAGCMPHVLFCIIRDPHLPLEILIAWGKLSPFLLARVGAHDLGWTLLVHFKVWPMWLVHGVYNTESNWSKAQNLLKIWGKKYSPTFAEYRWMQPSSWRKHFETMRGILPIEVKVGHPVETREKKKKKSVAWTGYTIVYP